MHNWYEIYIMAKIRQEEFLADFPGPYPQKTSRTTRTLSPGARRTRRIVSRLMFSTGSLFISAGRRLEKKSRTIFPGGPAEGTELCREGALS